LLFGARYCDLDALINEMRELQPGPAVVYRGWEPGGRRCNEEYRRAADTGYMEAQCALGTCYMYGIDTPVNKQLGKQWLQKPADQGYSEAKEKLRELQ
jgi:TPR repeat protein